MEALEVGGWYGGSGTYPDGSVDDDRGGGGGSGFVWTSGTVGNVPVGYNLTSSQYLTNAQTIGGNATMPAASGVGTVTGNEGNGYVKIISLNM